MSNKLSLLVQFGSAGLEKLNGGLKNIVGLSKSGAGALRELQRDSARLKREMTETGAAIGKASGNVTHLIDRQRALADQIERTNQRIEQQKRLNLIDARAGAMRSRGEEMQGRGRDNIVGGAALAAPLFLAGRAAMQNEKAMALMGQKLDLTRSQTDRLGASLLRAARDAKQLPDNIIAGADFLASKGLGRKEVEAMMPVLGRFGTAWDADVIDSAKAAHANFLSLKVPLSDTAASLQIMAAAGKAGGFEVRDMAKEFPILASKMATLGSTGLPAVADLSAALQVLEAKTGDGAVAANALDNMMRFVGSAEGINKFKKLGIDIPAALKKAVAEGRSPLEEIARLTKQATGGDDSKIGLIFSDAQAMMGVTALIQEEKKYLAIRKAAMEARGLTDKEFQRLSGTSSANVQLLMGSLQGLSVTLGTHLLPSLITGAQWLTRTTSAIGDWAQANPVAAGTLMSLAKWLVITKISVGALQFAFGGTLKTAATVWQTFARWKELGTLARVFAMVKGAGLGFGRAMLFVGRAMLMNPIGLLVTAIGVAAFLIWKHWDKIKLAFTAALGWLGGVWTGLKSNAMKMLDFAGPIGWAAKLIITHWDTIKSAFGNAFNFIAGFPGRFMSVGRAIIDGLVSGISAAPGKIWAALKSIIGGAWANAKAFLGINSPSRLFMTMGGFVADGLAIGMDQGQRRPIDSARRLAQGVAGGFAVPRSPFAAGGAPAPAGGASAGRATSAAPSIRDIIFNLQQQPGENAEQFAKRVLAEIRKLLAREARGSYEDR